MDAIGRRPFLATAIGGLPNPPLLAQQAAVRQAANQRYKPKQSDLPSHLKTASAGVLIPMRCKISGMLLSSLINPPKWAMYMQSLKPLCETGTGRPYPADMSID